MKIKYLIKKILKNMFTFNTIEKCEKCGWQTINTDMTEKLKKHCEPCGDKNKIK